ncbi:LolA-related protein, partial [Kaarinaea lacus]
MISGVNNSQGHRRSSVTARHLDLVSRICFCAIFFSAFFFSAACFSADSVSNDTTGSAKMGAISLSTLMESRKSVSQSRVRFREEKTISALNEELVMEGELIYRFPDYLAKQYSSPEKISYEVTSNMVTITTSQEKKQVNLGDIPVLHSLITALRGLLSGDISSIEALFKVDFSSTAQNWKMVLTPRNDSLKQYVAMMVFTGTNNDIQQLEFHE